MTVRIGIIGAGMIGADHARRLTDVVKGAEVVAVTDIDADRARALAASRGAKAYASGAELVASPDVDAVVVTSWGPTHAEHVLAAVAAGKPVFCEKPLATDAADCRAIVEAETAAGRRLVQVGFMRRFDAGYRQARNVLRSGRVGEALMVHAAHRNPTVPEGYHSAMAAQDTAVHEIDTLRWLLDDEFVSAQVLRPRQTRHRFEHLTDPQILLFETSRGTRIDLEVFVNCRYGYHIACETVGELGTVRLPDPAHPAVTVDGGTTTAVAQTWVDRFADAFDLEFTAFTAAAAEGTATGPSSWDGYAATVIGDATVESMHSSGAGAGAVVRIEMPERPAFYRHVADDGESAA